MKHIRQDYNERIQDKDFLIPSDEPVMLFRAQDVYAPMVLDHYAHLIESDEDSSPDSMEVARRAREQAQNMRNWSKKKFPDMPEGA